ncbi:GIY-YIG nuclease family protein [Romboutsia lituseburensis]|uniref:GIY-YIG nuclease family protein n=1 Tax=Romboutsia lituseburensis TaxID=1537 RepID=UPI00215A6D05|nr:GIY-YIG nuclease family protein [Romboutsia lituseburensis]MCR8744900.1 GIY-YIG nuclease family protein [Romboutsia lituseburensis]
MNLKEKINTFPRTPGVYIMKDKNGEPIYIGKSKKLQNRIKSYFINSKSHSRKTQRMVKGIYDIEIINTDTELDALLLECKMIKEIKPMYNKLMKNHENYLYLKINNSIKYPYLEVVNEVNDNNLYFGPYAIGNKLYDIKNIINESYKLRGCKRMNKCIKYDLSQCLGPCRNAIEEYDYQKKINEIINDLKGNSKNILISLENSMQSEINLLNFENASRLKQNIDMINTLFNKQNIINETIYKENTLAWMKVNSEDYKVYFIRNGKLVDCEVIQIKQFEKINKKEYFFNKLNLFNEKTIMNKDIINQKYDLDFIIIINSYIKHSNEVMYILL